MGTERQVVTVTTEGVEQSKAQVRSLDAEMNKLTADAQRAQAAVNRTTSLGSRAEGLLQRARGSGIFKRGGFELGPVELSGSGFGLNNSWMRGRGAGAASGPLLAAYIVSRLAHGVGNAMENAADARDWWKAHSHLTGAQLANEAYHRASEGVLDRMGVFALAKGFDRLFNGTSAEDSAAVFDRFRLKTFAPADYEKSQRLERAEFNRRQAAIDQAKAAAAEREREHERKIDEVNAKIDKEVERALNGLKSLRPEGFLFATRAQAKRYQARVDAVNQNAIRSAAAAEKRIAKAKVNEGN